MTLKKTLPTKVPISIGDTHNLRYSEKTYAGTNSHTTLVSTSPARHGDEDGNETTDSAYSSTHFSPTPTTSLNLSDDGTPDKYNFRNGCISKSLNHGIPSDIDLEGGTLLSVEEREEIDPEDNCKVQITCYHILSADRSEESTITKRRKLKVNCTQSLKRVEFSNGKQSKVEEKTMILDNVDALRDYPGVSQHPALQIHHSRDASDPVNASESEDISDVLMQTQNTFLSLLNEKKDQLMLTFPDLFSNLRSQPAIFQSTPSTVMRTVVNPDGSMTTHTKSSKAFSSRYTCQETYLNGVRQESTSKFRAFMEYAGPEGGFCIRLNDTDADEELSESEDNDLIQQLPPAAVPAAIENNNGTSTTLLNEDGQSRISRSGLSEIPDTASALVTHVEDGTLVPKLTSEPMKRREKAWHAVNELVESEGRYVQKLALLEKFREEVDRERILDRRQMCLLFSNIESLHRFHNDHLLPQLMDRHREWQSTRKISDVMRKQAPFLKMYSEYTRNYKRAIQTFEECARKKKHFEELVRRIEHLPECENLSLQSHLICPVQRVMRYQLLLKEYQKYLSDSDADFVDTEVALTLVLEAASHANEMMRKLDRYRNVLEVQEQLGNAISLVSPSRELLTKAKLMKISSTTNKVEERFLFVFNDLFLLVSERSSIGLISGSKFKVRAIFDACYTQICEGDNFEREHSFYLRGADSATAPLRCVELYCSCQSEKNKLFEVIWSVIDEAQTRRISFQNNTSKNCNNNYDNPNNNNNESSNVNNNSSTPPGLVTIPPVYRAECERKACVRCDVEFTWYSRGYVCWKCAKRFCKKCFGRLRYEAKAQRLCTECLRMSVPLSNCQSTHFEEVSTTNENQYHPRPHKRRNLLATPADDTTEVIKAGYVKFRGTFANLAGAGHGNGTTEKYFVLRRNFCLYSYKNDRESCASAMMPMAGCDVSPNNSDKLGFIIRHMNRVYHILCANESDHAEWLAALILSANAKLPDEVSDEVYESAASQKTVKRSASVGDKIANSAASHKSNSSSLKPPTAFSHRNSASRTAPHKFT